MIEADQRMLKPRLAAQQSLNMLEFLQISDAAEAERVTIHQNDACRGAKPGDRNNRWQKLEQQQKDTGRAEASTGLQRYNG